MDLSNFALLGVQPGLEKEDGLVSSRGHIQLKLFNNFMSSSASCFVPHSWNISVAPCTYPQLFHIGKISGKATKDVSGNKDRVAVHSIDWTGLNMLKQNVAVAKPQGTASPQKCSHPDHAAPPSDNPSTLGSSSHPVLSLKDLAEVLCDGHACCMGESLTNRSFNDILISEIPSSYIPVIDTWGLCLPVFNTSLRSA